jgi:hypothetical protein
MTDDDLFALCIEQEAGNQPHEGRVAVARVIHNRIAQLYESDGTVAGTILKYDQFSWAYFSMVGGQYLRQASTSQEAANRANALLSEAQASPVWADCQQAVTDGAIGSDFAWGPQGLLLNAEPRALLYVDLAISQPAWAIPETYICKVFAHSFYKA